MSFQLAAEIIPRMLPMNRRHDLAMALLADSSVRHGSGKSGAHRGQLGLARFLQEYPHTGRMRDRGAAESHAVVAQKHREILTECSCKRDALVLRCDQRHLILVARYALKIIGVHSKRL